MSTAAPLAEPASGDLDSSPPGAPFSDLLRERTKLVHREAERSGFIADLIRGRATREAYALFLRNLVPVYTALEAALDRSEPTPLLRPFADPRLRRLPGLRSDLEGLGGTDWSGLPIVPESLAYATAIDRAAEDGEHRLAAHAYARYLGDLSGGQILRPLLSRTLGLAPDMLSLYAFPALADLDTPKAAMRRALDAVLPASPAAAALVAEAIAAFRHNIAMSTAVAISLA